MSISDKLLTGMGGVCCCGVNCGCSCPPCACASWGAAFTGVGAVGTALYGYPASTNWTADEAARYERKHYADQCCKHDEKSPHKPKAVREEGGLWRRVVTDLEKL